MIKAIIFDLGGVLIDHPGHGMFSYYAKSLGVSKAGFEKAYGTIGMRWMLGKISEKELWQQICRQLQKPLPAAESLWLEGYQSTYHEKPEMLTLVRELKETGFGLGLLSNTEPPIMELHEKAHYPYFDVFVYSCGVGMVKPDRTIYLHTAEKLGVKPQETIFVDDLIVNIEGARKVGMHGILFSDPVAFRKELFATLSK